MISDALTIQGWIGRHAKYRPHKMAIICGERRLTFHELNEQINQLIHAFQQAGLKKGDKIATLLSNSVELWEVYWACAKMGTVAVPLSPLLREQGLYNLLNNADTKLLITSSDMEEAILSVIKHFTTIRSGNIWIVDKEETQAPFSSYIQQKNKHTTAEPEVEPVSANDTYNIIYSSGTTGLPKGIVIPHGVRALYGSVFANAYRMTPESIVMHSGSIVFNGAFLTLMPAMFLGCTYILMPHFHPQEVIQTIYNEKVTHTILVPSQLISCLQYEKFNKQHLSTLEYVLSVGAPLLLEHKKQLGEKIPGIFYELYGLTEGFMTILDKNDFLRKMNSVGYPAPFMEMKIIDNNGTELPSGNVGEIIGNGPLLMTEYYKNPQLTQETLKNGWLYTGDLGYIDEDGFLYLTGRKKDLIISGGVNVYPADIEEIIVKHPAVKEVAVFGVPHIEWGETPVAAIVLKENILLDANEMKQWINQHIEARYQKINKAFFLTALPRNVAGKILKAELKKEYEKLETHETKKHEE